MKHLHFKEIIHIIDIDGMYIPDSAIIEDLEAMNPIYSLKEIRTANTNGIINRNKVKRENVNRLKTTGKIWSIPYKIYYMSCNLDQV